MEILNNKNDLKKCGIYSITNIVTQKEYIGSTTGRFDKRCREHISLLLKNKHDSPKLQHSWNKYGEKSFSFSILEICLPSQCVICEQKWINNRLPHINGYNICGTSGNCYGRKFSDETKQKMSLSHIGKKATDETKQKMSLSRKENLKNILNKLGYIPGHSHTEKTKEKISKNNAKFWSGKCRSSNDKQKMSKPKTFVNGISPLSKSVMATCNHITYTFTSIQEASKSSLFDNPLNPSHVVDCCKGKNKHTGKINGHPVTWKYHLWCPWCGVWGNHTSGNCKDLKKDLKHIK